MTRAAVPTAPLALAALLAALAHPVLADPGEKGNRVRGGEPRSEFSDDAPSPIARDHGGSPRWDDRPARSSPVPAAPRPAFGDPGSSDIAVGRRPALEERRRGGGPGEMVRPPLPALDSGGGELAVQSASPSAMRDDRRPRRRPGRDDAGSGDSWVPGAGRSVAGEPSAGLDEPDDRALTPAEPRLRPAWTGQPDRRPALRGDAGPSDPEQRRRWLETDSSNATWRERAAIAEARDVAERERRRAEDAARRAHADSARALRWHWATDPRWRYDIRYGFYDPFWRFDARWGWFDPRWGWNPRWGFDPRWGWGPSYGRGFDWSWGVGPRTAIRQDPLLYRWALEVFDRDRDGRLGPRETDRAAWALLRVADLNGNGRLDGREIAFARAEIRRFGWERFRWDPRWERDWGRPGWHEPAGWDGPWGWSDRRPGGR